MQMSVDKHTKLTERLGLQVVQFCLLSCYQIPRLRRRLVKFSCSVIWRTDDFASSLMRNTSADNIFDHLTQAEFHLEATDTTTYFVVLEVKRAPIFIHQTHETKERRVRTQHFLYPSSYLSPSLVTTPSFITRAVESASASMQTPRLLCGVLSQSRTGSFRRNGRSIASISQTAESSL
jgi:hypothetical protein